MNTGIGYNAGTLITTTASLSNTFIGSNAGAARTSYNNCTFVGDTADASAAALSYAMALGSGTSVTTSNSCVIGQANATGFVSVGINIASPIGFGLHLGNAGATKNPLLVIDSSTTAASSPATTNQIQFHSAVGKPMIAANLTQYTGTVVTANNSTSPTTCGTVTLNGGTAVVVSTTAIATTSLIFLSRNSGTGAPPTLFAGTVAAGDIVAGTSFSVLSTNALDTAVLNWLIINP